MKCFKFPKIKSGCSVDANLTLDSGEQTVNVSSMALENLWRYYVLTPIPQLEQGLIR